MRLSSHPNVLVCHTSFVRDTDLWLVTQLMSKGSSLHCLQHARAKLLTDAADAAGPDDAFGDATFAYTTDDAVLEGGLRIETTLDLPLQQEAVAAVQSGLRALSKRQGYRGPLRQVKRDAIDAELAKLAIENGSAASSPASGSGSMSMH